MANAVVNNFVMITVAVIMGLGVTVPVINQVISSGNLSGITGVIGGFLPTFVVVGLLILIITYTMG